MAQRPWAGGCAGPGHSELGLNNLNFKLSGHAGGKASGTELACRRSTAQHTGVTQSDTVTDTARRRLSMSDSESVTVSTLPT